MNRCLTTCTVFFLVAFGTMSAQNLEWLQHLVASTSNFGNGIYADPDGNYYITGYFGGSMDFGGQTLNGAGAGDIFIAKYNSSRGLKWVRQGTSSGWNGGRGVAADGDGNVIVGGRFQMSTAFDGITMNAVGDNDAFVAKYSAEGSVQWVKSGGGGSADWINNVGVDDNGNIYATGYFTAGATFDGQSVGAAGVEDVLIVSYSPTGSLRWVKSGGGAGTDAGYGVAAIPSGGVYVVGAFVAGATFSGTSINGSGEGTGFIAKYADNGDLTWVKALPGTVTAEKVSLDGDGNVFVTGAFTGNATFGGATLNSAGEEDVYVAKIAPDGNPIAAWKIGGSGADGLAGFGQSSQVVAREDGGFFIVTNFENSVTLGEFTVQSLGGRDFLIAQFDKDGNVLWLESGGGTDYEGFVGVGVDAGNNAYMFGNYFSTSYKMGLSQIPRFGGFADMFVAKIAGSGGSNGVPKVKVDTEVIDFGDVAVGSSQEMFLVVEKGSPATLTVQNVSFNDPQSTSKGFDITEPTSDAFPTDLNGTQRLFVTVEFTPTAIGNVQSTILVETNDEALPQVEIVVTGNGIDPGSLPTAQFSTTLLNIGDVVVGTERSGSFTISPANAAGLVVEGLEFENPASILYGYDIVAPTSFPVTLNGGQTLDVVVSYTPDQFGEATARLVVQTNDAEKTFTNIDVQGTGVEAPVAQLSTFDLQFGEVKVNEKKEKSFTITSNGGGALQIESIAIVTPNIRDLRVVNTFTFPVELNPGQSETVTVEFAPKEEESIEAVLNVVTNDPLLPVAEITMSGTGSSLSSVDDETTELTNVAVQVTPNPIQTSGDILIDIAERGQMVVEVVDINGKSVATLFKGLHSGGALTVHLDASTLEAGTYLCMVQIGGKRYHRMITVL